MILRYTLKTMAIPYPRKPFELDKRRKLTQAQLEEVIELRKNNYAYNYIAKKFGVAKQTVMLHCYKVLEPEKFLAVMNIKLSYEYNKYHSDEDYRQHKIKQSVKSVADPERRERLRYYNKEKSKIAEHNRSKNPDRIEYKKNYNKKYRIEHKDKITEKNKKYRENNRKKVAEYQHKYYKKNKDRIIKRNKNQKNDPR